MRYYRRIFRLPHRLQMQKLLIYLACFASLQLTACSSSEERNKNTPRTTWLETIPIVYRQDIQQGNVVTQEAVDRLEPGMSKRQVRFLLGAPLLVDVFHDNRWDYIYRMTEGWSDTEQQHLILYFEDERLIKLEGDFRPNPEASEANAEKAETVFDVPDWEDPDAGIFSRAARSVTQAFDAEENISEKAASRRATAEKQVIQAEEERGMSNPPPSQ